MIFGVMDRIATNYFPLSRKFYYLVEFKELKGWIHDYEKKQLPIINAHV
jgi:hypothetical protein